MSYPSITVVSPVRCRYVIMVMRYRCTKWPTFSGRHACAGRFFAAVSSIRNGSFTLSHDVEYSSIKVELKIMLAHMLLEYDISYPPTVTQRPKNMVFNGAVIPDSKARLLFKRRKREELESDIIPAYTN